MKSLVCFSSISLSDPVLHGEQVAAQVTLDPIDGHQTTFPLQLRYPEPLHERQLPIIRMACCMPLLNYGLFTTHLHLDFPLCKADSALLHDFHLAFSRDIYVNRLISGTNDYLLPPYIPRDVSPQAAEPRADIQARDVTADMPLTGDLDAQRCGILSSGGKESLLTYGLLNEIEAETYPLYVNESGGHWRTALTAYRHHRDIDSHTMRVWTNVDRFYAFMLDHLPFIRSDHRNVRADAYPIRLCIFPHYIFTLLPLFMEHGIGNLLMGSEFDDWREKPVFQGIPHYHSIYDQHQDFDIRMNQWYQARMPGLRQWSALRGITGLIVERILFQRYPPLARLQRSCHSCHFENGDVMPCGVCSKCYGVLLFLLANGIDPTLVNYTPGQIASFQEKVSMDTLRLDIDEALHSLHLLGYPEGQYVEHVEQMHLCEDTCSPRLVPARYRKPLLDIIDAYISGYCTLHQGEWVPAPDGAARSLTIR